MSQVQAPSPVLTAALEGLTAPHKTLPPWLFYDERGSALFEQITDLPEYYLTRTERQILTENAPEILSREVTLVELGAGTATKTGILLTQAASTQAGVLYQPIDVSPSALAAAQHLEQTIPGLRVQPQVANYITEPYTITREPHRHVLALYIGSSIGNFAPAEARAILTSLRTQLHPGDTLLLGTDLAPGPNKSVSTLLAAYDDAQGITTAFNKNILTHLNRELAANFDLDCFRHLARWNPTESRIEMHLESLIAQTVTLAGTPIAFAAGETIHTENSYKFTPATIATLLKSSGYRTTQTLTDPKSLFAVTLAEAI